MKTSSPRHGLVLALLAATAGCGGDPCDDVRTVEQALTSTCGIADDTPPAPQVACTPRPGILCTVMGTGNAGFGENLLPGTETRIYLPQDVAVGPDLARAYVLDWNNHVIRELGPDGRARIVAGTGELQDGEDPPVPPDAPRVPQPALRHRLNHPTDMAFDGQGRMLIAAWHNSMVKRLNNIGRPDSMIEDLCGTGGRNFAGDGGPALRAVLDLPVGVAVSPAGDVYIADQANQRIRRVNGDGTISTVVGSGERGYAGDGGPALQARLNNPTGQAANPAGRIAFDAQGNLYIADTGNNVIRRVDAQGIISTFAGNGTAGALGDGGAATGAQLNQPTDVEVGPDGTVYIADTQNSCIRAVDTQGILRTVAGRCGQRGFRGDGAAPTEALLDRPYGVETDSAGRLWISDTYNHRVRVMYTR